MVTFGGSKAINKNFYNTKKNTNNNAIKHQVFRPPRIGVGPTPFSAISLLQAQLTHETLPPPCGAGWPGAGGRVAWRLGWLGGMGGGGWVGDRAAGQGGWWLVAGRLGTAWWHGMDLAAWIWRHGMVAWQGIK